MSLEYSNSSKVILHINPLRAMSCAKAESHRVIDFEHMPDDY